MDIQKSFTYPFDDEEWPNKVLIGALISAVPILGLAASGYWLGVIKNVVQDQTRPLSNWDDIGNMFVRGLMYTLGVLAYSLPLLIVVCLFAALGGGFSALMSDSQSGEGAMAALFSVGGIFFGCFSLLYLLAMLVILPAATVRFALTNQIGEMFKVNALLDDIRRNVSGYLTAVLVMIVAGIGVFTVVGAAGTVLSIVPVCGWIVAWLLNAAASFYLQLVSSHLWGQFFRTARPSGLVVS